VVSVCVSVRAWPTPPPAHFPHLQPWAPAARRRVPATTPETTYDPAIRRVEYTFVPPKATVRFQEKNGAAIPEIKDDELRAIFREFDLNGDGFIQMNELRSVMVKMGQSPTDEELTAMFNAADKDKDGNIDFQGAYLRLVIR
jgi:hypothetical protein